MCESRAERCECVRAQVCVCACACVCVRMRACALVPMLVGRWGVFTPGMPWRLIFINTCVLSRSTQAAVARSLRFQKSWGLTCGRVLHQNCRDTSSGPLGLTGIDLRDRMRRVKERKERDRNWEGRKRTFEECTQRRLCRTKHSSSSVWCSQGVDVPQRRWA